MRQLARSEKLPCDVRAKIGKLTFSLIFCSPQRRIQTVNQSRCVVKRSNGRIRKRKHVNVTQRRYEMSARPRFEIGWRPARVAKRSRGHRARRSRPVVHHSEIRRVTVRNVVNSSGIGRRGDDV